MNTIENFKSTTFEELQEECKDYDVSFKDDNNLFMIYYNQKPKYDTFEFHCKSIVFDKKLMKPIVSQYNNVLYNTDALSFIQDKSWNNITIQKCYEGTMVIVFFHEDVWYVTTRRCLDAQKSTWIKDNSYYSLFMDAIKDKFTFNDLDKNNCYHFVLVHHKNKNIVVHSDLGSNYNVVFHVLTTEKYTMKEVVCKLKNVDDVKEEQFESLDKVLMKLDELNYNDVRDQKVTVEGYVLKYYCGEVHNSCFLTMKLQTKLYETVTKLKPNNSNIYQCFLELYQSDNLVKLVPFFVSNCGEVVNRIHMSMRNMAKELLNLYHVTRNKKSGVYECLTGSYRKCLYDIHGLYITKKESVNVYDVYGYLKRVDFGILRQVYFDRTGLSKNEKCKFINNNCGHTLIQTKLMFEL